MKACVCTIFACFVAFTAGYWTAPRRIAAPAESAAIDASEMTEFRREVMEYNVAANQDWEHKRDGARDGAHVEMLLAEWKAAYRDGLEPIYKRHGRTPYWQADR